MPFDFSTPFAIFVQCIGFLAMGIGICSYQAKRRTAILLIQATASLLWSAQFLLLGQWTGAILNILAILRGLVYAKKDQWAWVRSVAVPVGFSVAFAVAGILTVPGLFSGEVTLPDLFLALLPIAAMVLSSFALHVTGENRIRILCFFCSPPWLVYDLLVGSMAGVFTESFTMVSIVVALLRFWRPKSGKAPESTRDEGN